MVALRIVTPAGDVVDLSAERDPDVLAQVHRHVEFFAFPHSDTVQVKLQDLTDEPSQGRQRRDLNEVVIEKAFLWLISDIVRTAPHLSPVAGRLIGRDIGTVEGVDAAYRVFANRRWARFNEMEYALPFARMPEAVGELHETIARRRMPVHFPIEVRCVAGDDIWLSPAYRRDSAYVAVHAYQGMPFRDYFLAAEEIFLRHGGRPHWGKAHSLRGDQLKLLYPRWDDFLRVREDLDPDGMMLNRYLESQLGLA